MMGWLWFTFGFTWAIMALYFSMDKAVRHFMSQVDKVKREGRAATIVYRFSVDEEEE